MSVERDVVQMPEEKKEEKPSFLKRIFKGDTLNGAVEAGRVKPLTEFTDLEEKRKKLLERLSKVEKTIKESKK